MGIFGGLKSGANIDPSMLSKLSLGDRARLFAIGMNDPSAAMQMKQQMQIRPAQQAFMSNLEKRLGPQYAETQGAGAAIQAPSMPGMPQAEAAPEYQWQAPQRTSDGLNINSPELGGIAMQAERLGVPITTLMDVLKAQQPDMAIGPDGTPYNKRSAAGLPQRFANRSAVANTIVDLNDPENTNRVVPEAPVKGAMPIYDNRGRVTDWSLPRGAVGAIQGATNAEAMGRTMGTVFQNPSNGGMKPTLGRDMFGGGDNGGAFGQGDGASGAGTTQSPADQAYDVDTAKAAAAQYTGIQTAGQRASGTISNYRRMANLLEGLNTGKLTPAALGVASALSSFGIQASPNMSSIEAANALASKLTLDSMGGSLGAGFSNADRSFVESMNPSIANTPQGRKLMIDFGVARAQREQEVASMARQWVQKAGRLDRPDRSGRTFYDYLDAYAAANPLMKAAK